MDNKKTKLTISGGSKKSFKDSNNQKNQGKKTVIINRQSIKFAGKSNYAKVSGFKTSSNNAIRISMHEKEPPKWYPPLGLASSIVWILNFLPLIVKGWLRARSFISIIPINEKA